MDMIKQILVIALLVAVLTDRFKKVISDRYTLAASIAIGIALAVVYRLGLIASLGMVSAIPYGEHVDYVLTGVMIAFGPNEIYNYVMRRQEYFLDSLKLKLGGSDK